jgi:hypothetical protein
MASAYCTNLNYKFFNGSWSYWKDDLQSGYAGNKEYVTVLRFKTPDVTKITNTSLKFSIPCVRQYQPEAPQEGTLYVKLYTSDPTGAAESPYICTIPNAGTCDDSFYYNHYDFQVFYANFEINNKTLYGGTTYYLVIGNSAAHLSIGSGSHQYTITLEYTSYTDGSMPTIKIVDNGDNSCMIQCVLGMEGNYNPMESAKLCYTTDGTTPNITSNPISIPPVSGTTYNKIIKISSGPTTTVRAFILCKYKYNSGNPGEASKAIKYYAAPKAPGKPVVYYNKNKLTNRENWTVSWSAAKAANDNSPIKGYRFRIYKKAAGATKFTTIKIYDTAGKLLSKDMGTDSGVIDHRYYYDVASLSMIIDPVKHGIVPGDTIKIGLYAYAKNGVGTQLFTASQTFSDELVVQNAGIVNIKINNSWHEGQVYVKAGGVWHEAETVNVKTAAGWRESQ